MLENPDRSQLMGAKIPKSILIKGYKGCGKTFLATAIAGESELFGLISIVPYPSKGLGFESLSFNSSFQVNIR